MLINGKPGESIPVSDRGFLYGDGVFETIRVINHQLSLWQLHQQRLLKSCERLNISVDYAKLKNELENLLTNCDAEGIVKIIISRGSGGRGYQAINTGESTRIVQFLPLPSTYNQHQRDGVRVKFCDQPISVNSQLGGIKHLGRLDQVLASNELADSFDEGIMSTDSGRVVEGTKSNLFIALDGKLLTPNLADSGVAGVMREYLISRFEAQEIPVTQAELARDNLYNASELFLCNSVFGVWPVTELVYQADSNVKVHNKIVGPLTRQALEFQDDEFGSYQ